MRLELHSAASLRRELSARNLEHAASRMHETTFGAVPSVLYGEDDRGEHGNFLAASYRRICANAAWSARLKKAYTGGARVPRRADRERCELDTACSSDALLMNIFCYPRATFRPELCGLLRIEPGLRPEFGVRAHLAMRNGETDRTEMDMVLGGGSERLLVEAKLTESGFQSASMERLLRYEGIAEVFDVDALPRGSRGVPGYQLVRGVLAAWSGECRFALLCDGRRADLEDAWFRVLCAVRSFDLRSRMQMVSWQEVAATMPRAVQGFLQSKYGIASTR